MTTQNYMAAIRTSTIAALNSGLSLPEIIGCLELAKLNTERMAYERACQAGAQQSGIIAASILPPNPEPGKN